MNVFESRSITFGPKPAVIIVAVVACLLGVRLWRVKAVD